MIIKNLYMPIGNNEEDSHKNLFVHYFVCVRDIRELGLGLWAWGLGLG